MISINWFEVLLPSQTFNIPVEILADTAPAPKRQKSIHHWTVLHTRDRTLYHVTAMQPSGTILKEVDFNQNPSIAVHAIENGFAAHLEKAGFGVRLRHVGGVGYRSVDKSILPTIYESLEGIKFRCFYGFGRNDPLRWGLILSFVTSQRFTISLQNPYLRELAHGKRVVPFGVYDAETDASDTTGQYSGILDSVKEGRGILIDRDGQKQEVELSQWTLPCSRENLSGLIRRVENPTNASKLVVKLQQDALALTSEGRINTNLARDQLEKLQALMSENNLLNFQLPLLERPFVRVSQEPLVVGD
ncbi:MAG: hypothetical protein HYR94_09500 [Chloroflexi bacterium]|nr:hypothetical protein [Chloroflexota bacterium]